MRYQQIVSCDGAWEYCHYQGDKELRYPVAAWALTEDNEVIGLIAVPKGGKSASGAPRLHEPPPAPDGQYVRR